MSVNNESKDLKRMQRQFVFGAAMLVPISPFLFIQGQITRWKVGLLPDAAGDKYGRAAAANVSEDAATLFVIGESTVAGLGARDHEHAMAGQFALALSEYLGRAVDWEVAGMNGVTARRLIDEVLPAMPDKPFDHILLGIGGNDVIKLSSPRKWRRDMLELISRVRELQPQAAIFISNCPMILSSPAIPEPIKSILWRLSRMHDANIREFTKDLERVFYFPQPDDVRGEGFFADGIHPSERGYKDWAFEMVQYFSETYKW